MAMNGNLDTSYYQPSFTWCIYDTWEDEALNIADLLILRAAGTVNHPPRPNNAHPIPTTQEIGGSGQQMEMD